MAGRDWGMRRMEAKSQRAGGKAHSWAPTRLIQTLNLSVKKKIHFPVFKMYYCNQMQMKNPDNIYILPLVPIVTKWSHSGAHPYGLRVSFLTICVSQQIRCTRSLQGTQPPLVTHSGTLESAAAQRWMQQPNSEAGHCTTSDQRHREGFFVWI